MNFHWHGVIATALMLAGLLIGLGAIALFLTGRFGVFPVEIGEVNHDSRYIVLKKQVHAVRDAVRNFPEIRGQF